MGRIVYKVRTGLWGLCWHRLHTQQQRDLICKFEFPNVGSCQSRVRHGELHFCEYGFLLPSDVFSVRQDDGEDEFWEVGEWNSTLDFEQDVVGMVKLVGTKGEWWRPTRWLALIFRIQQRVRVTPNCRGGDSISSFLSWWSFCRRSFREVRALSVLLNPSATSYTSISSLTSQTRWRHFEDEDILDYGT